MKLPMNLKGYEWGRVLLFIPLSFIALFLPDTLLIALWILIIAMCFLEAMKLKLWHGFRRKTEIHGRSIRPKVSVHLAICNEPPEMVVKTIQGILAQNYADFEVIVVDNNTKVKKIWSPVAEFCRPLANVRFYHLEKWPFFKSGALNFARKVTDPKAEFIFVIDADYVLERHALKTAVSNVESTSIALVQFPQAYSSDESRHKPLLDEFDHFFNYYCSNADRCYGALATGTLSLIRIDALDSVGGWPLNSITEDAELGARLQMCGYHIKYVHRIVGKGIAPIYQDDFLKQRKRWIYGNVQSLMNYSLNPLRNFEKWISGISQLTAWTNLLGLPILCLLICLLQYTWLEQDTFNQLAGWAYLAYWIFALSKMLQLHLADGSRTGSAFRTFLIHFATLDIGAFHWWPVLLGQRRPFVRTEKSGIESSYRLNLLYPMLHLGLFLCSLYSGFIFVAASALVFFLVHSMSMGLDYHCRTKVGTTVKLHLKLQS